MAQRHLEPAQPAATFALWRVTAQGLLHGPEVCIETCKGPYSALVLQPCTQRGLQLHEALLICVSSHAEDAWNARMAFLDPLSASALLRVTLAAVCGASPVLHEHMSSAEGC